MANQEPSAEVLEVDELERLATQELMNEAKRGAERAKDYGSYGWLKSHTPPANKRFLANTLVSTLRNPPHLRHKDRDGYRRQRRYSGDSDGSTDRRHKSRSPAERRRRKDSDKGDYQRERAREHRHSRKRNHSNKNRSHEERENQVSSDNRADYQKEHKRKTGSSKDKAQDWNTTSVSDKNPSKDLLKTISGDDESGPDCQSVSQGFSKAEPPREKTIPDDRAISEIDKTKLREGIEKEKENMEIMEKQGETAQGNVCALQENPIEFKHTQENNRKTKSTPDGAVGTSEESTMLAVEESSSVDHVNSADNSKLENEKISNSKSIAKREEADEVKLFDSVESQSHGLKEDVVTECSSTHFDPGVMVSSAFETKKITAGEHSKETQSSSKEMEKEAENTKKRKHKHKHKNKNKHKHKSKRKHKTKKSSRGES